MLIWLDKFKKIVTGNVTGNAAGILVIIYPLALLFLFSIYE